MSDFTLSCECEYCQADEHPRFKYLEDALAEACQWIIDMQYNQAITVKELRDLFIKKATENDR